MGKITIALLDTHILFRKGLAGLINQFEDYTVLMDAGSEEELLQQFRIHGLPQIVLTAIMLPVKSGYQTTQWLRQHHPSIKVIALSAIYTDFAVVQMVASGACGFTTKSVTPLQLKSILDKATHPDFHGGGLHGLYAQRMLPSQFSNLHKAMEVRLSEIEISLLQLCCTEMTYAQIAEELSLTEKAVDRMRDKLFQKLDLQNRPQLAVFAVTNGLRMDMVPLAVEV
jgi:two-component system, NarL family, invasion response regulator UvrY